MRGLEKWEQKSKNSSNRNSIGSWREWVKWGVSCCWLGSCVNFVKNKVWRYFRGGRDEGVIVGGQVN